MNEIEQAIAFLRNGPYRRILHPHHEIIMVALREKQEREEQPVVCWCKDCECYTLVDDDSMMCLNHDSEWSADYPSEYNSCQYCKPRALSAPPEPKEANK